jgi:hypothetical protein
LIREIRHRAQDVSQVLQLFALVDYANVAPLRRGLLPTYEDHRSAVDAIVLALTGLAEMLKPAPNELRIRLYGGWHSAITGSSTEEREILGSISRKFFPTRGRQRILLELADSLVGLPEEQLDHTLRHWNGLLPFSLGSAADLCPLDPRECPLHDFGEWRRGRCPRWSSCHRTTYEVAQSLRQKLVDTAIVADTLTLAMESSGWVAAVSNDDDVVPGVLAGARYNPRVILVHVARRTPSPYKMLMERRSVSLFNLGA